MAVDEDKYLEEHYKRVKPCPFCGSTRVLAEKSDNYGKCYVWCDGCLAEGPNKSVELFDEYQNAFDAWNNREGGE
jgi:Lar family restriction alleviation protein